MESNQLKTNPQLNQHTNSVSYKIGGLLLIIERNASCCLDSVDSGNVSSENQAFLVQEALAMQSYSLLMRDPSTNDLCKRRLPGMVK